MEIKREVDINGWGGSKEEIPVCSECGGWLGFAVPDNPDADDSDDIYNIFLEHVDWKFCPFCGKPLAAEENDLGELK